MSTALNFVPRASKTLGVSSVRLNASVSDASEGGELRAEPRYACDYGARIASADRVISTAGRIVAINSQGAKVEVMFPRRGPSTILLFDLENSDIWECEVRWRTDDHIGVRFLDILGPGRRRKYFAGESVPVKKTAHEIVRLERPPVEDVRPGPPPRRIGARRRSRENYSLFPPTGAPA